MKKDIEIPEVKDVEIAIVKEDNDDWSVYILNKKETDIEMVVIVSQGFSETKTTSLFRRRIDKLPAKSSAKFELIQPELFALDNRFQVTFFENNTLYDKTYIFKKNTVKDGSLRMIKMLNKRGIVAV